MDNLFMVNAESFEKNGLLEKNNMETLRFPSSLTRDYFESRYSSQGQPVENRIPPMHVLCIAQENIGEQLEASIHSAGGEIHFTTNLFEAQDLISQHCFGIGIIQFDLFNDISSTNAINSIISEGKHIEWVALVSANDIENITVRQVIAEHFYDYHTLPVDLKRLLVTLGHAYGMADIRKTVFKKANGAFSTYEMVGNSPAMRAALHRMSKLVHVEAPVLVTGESGTGKELAALAIHNHSPRREGPFVAVNCGSLPANLIQSELFGYEKGAFTGANQRKIGFIERAQGGTMFLDEIGDLPLDLQVNLLRFVQTKTIYRIGGHQEIPVDVRIISATHVNLEKAIERGNFREDLFYRLNVLQIEMPPLRERGQDIELLAQFFFGSFQEEGRSKAKGLSQQALRALFCHSWPGNVRELRNRIHRAMVMCEGRLIGPADLGLENEIVKLFPLNLKEAKDKAEKELLQHALMQRGNCVTEAAGALGVSRVTLYRLLKKHGLDAVE
jgi:DNA-binding NtrC family response regulator